MNLYLLLTVLTVFLQLFTRNFFWPVVVVAVASQRLAYSRRVYVLAMVGGVLADLVTGRLLGQSAVFLLLVALVLVFLNQRFQKDLRLAAVVTFGAELVYFLLVSYLGF